MQPNVCHIHLASMGKELSVRCVAAQQGMTTSNVIHEGETVIRRLSHLFLSVVALRSFAAEDDRGVMAYLQEFGRQLYETLVRPIESALTNCDEIIVYHSERIVPFELAFDGQEFLATKYSIGNRTSSSSSFRRDVTYPHTRDLNMLCVGDEGSSLPRAIYSGARRGKYEAITRVWTEDLLHRLRDNDYSVVHFACHGAFDASRPNSSYLVLDPERAGNSGSAILTLEDLKSSNLAFGAQLVFLNACASGTVNEEYQGFVGFAGELLKGGVESCIAPLWSVSDGGASNFASSFYREALAGKSIGQALREARSRCWHEQRDVLTSLAYVLIGNPETVLSGASESGLATPNEPTPDGGLGEVNQTGSR